MPKFSTPALYIFFKNDKGEDTEIEKLQTTAADQLSFDMIRRNTPNFPSQTEAPMLWAYILAFAALRRTGVISDKHQFEEWISQNLHSVDLLPKEEADYPLAQPSATA